MCPAESSPSSLSLKSRYETSWGQVIKVVGSLPELGSWNPQAAPTMQWNEGHKWTLSLRLPKQSFSFKIICMSNGYIRWEDGEVNRSIDHLESDSQSSQPGPVDLVVQLTCNFGATESTELALVLSKEKIEGALETARAALEMLQKRKAQAERSLQALGVGASKGREPDVMAMREAIASQSLSVADLSDLLEKNSGGADGEIIVPIKQEQLRQLPSLSSGGRPADITRLVRSLKRGFDAVETPSLPSPSTYPADQEEQASAPTDTPQASAPIDAPPASAPIDAPQVESNVVPFPTRVEEPPQVTNEAPLPPPIHSPPPSHPPPPRTPSTPTSSGSSTPLSPSTEGGISSRNELGIMLSEAATALDDVSSRLSAFLSNQSPDGMDAKDLKELARLMAEAESAWTRAAALNSVDEEDIVGSDAASAPVAAAPESEVISFSFKDNAMEEEMVNAARNQAVARETLLLRLAGRSPSPYVSPLEKSSPIVKDSESQPRPPVANDPEPPVANDPEPPVANDPEPPVAILTTSSNAVESIVAEGEEKKGVEVAEVMPAPIAKDKDLVPLSPSPPIPEPLTEPLVAVGSNRYEDNLLKARASALRVKDAKAKAEASQSTATISQPEATPAEAESNVEPTEPRAMEVEVEVEATLPVLKPESLDKVQPLPSPVAAETRVNEVKLPFPPPPPPLPTPQAESKSSNVFANFFKGLFSKM